MTSLLPLPGHQRSFPLRSLESPAPYQMSSAAIAVAILLVIMFSLVLFFSAPRDDDTKHEPMLQKIRQNFTALDPSYGKIPLYSGDSSFTDNKTSVTMCLRDPKTKKPYDDNTLMYVALHELAHIISRSYGHNEEFNRNFQQLRQTAHGLGIFDMTKPIPKDYCGMKENVHD